MREIIRTHLVIDAGSMGFDGFGGNAKFTSDFSTGHALTVLNVACFHGRAHVSVYKSCVHAHERAEATFFDRANFVFIPCRAR